jgi:hypothetical protein
MIRPFVVDWKVGESNEQKSSGASEVGEGNFGDLDIFQIR